MRRSKKNTNNGGNIQNAINLTNKEIPPIFTKVSNNVNNIAMTIADHIRAEEREITMEFATLNFIRNLVKKGCDSAFIADATQLSVKKVQEIIQKIKESSN